MIDRWLVAALVLLLCGVGCGGVLQGAIRLENEASVAAATAKDQIDLLCHNAMDHADTPQKADNVIATCSRAEDVYTAFRRAWLAGADAIRLAELGEKPANFDEIIALVDRSLYDLYAVIAQLKVL